MVSPISSNKHSSNGAFNRGAGGYSNNDTNSIEERNGCIGHSDNLPSRPPESPDECNQNLDESDAHPDELKRLEEDSSFGIEEMPFAIETSNDVKSMWIAYRANPSKENHSLVFKHYESLLDYLANKAKERLPEEVDVGDLKQDGALGLLEAIEKYEVDSGIKFETYAASRIRGAILDGLRAMDWVPRLDRARKARYQEAARSIAMQEGRSATEDEVIARLKIGGEMIEKYRSANRRANNQRHAGDFSVSRNGKGGDEEELRMEDLSVTQSTSSGQLTVESEDTLRELVRPLTDIQRKILFLYLHDEFTFREIGVILDLSESRISQLFKDVLLRISEELTLGRMMPMGTLSRDIYELYGAIPPQQMEYMETLTAEEVAAINASNENAPVKFALSGGSENFHQGNQTEFNSLVKRVGEVQSAEAPKALPPASQFTFVDVVSDE